MAIALGILVVLLALLILGRKVVKRWTDSIGAKRNAQIKGEICKCGYPLTELDQARCPECGRVLFFDATAEQLGLSAEELERAQRKRRERESREKRS